MSQLSIPTTLSPDQSRRAGRMLANGRLTATVKSHKTGEHITIKVVCAVNNPSAPYGKKWPAVSPDRATHVFLKDGATQIGMIKLREGRFLRAPQMPSAARLFAAAMVLRYACGEDFQSEVVEADQCGCCGRKLTDPESIVRGIGPECFGKQTGSVHHRDQPAPVQLSLDGLDPETRAIRVAERIESAEVAIIKGRRDGEDVSNLESHLAEIRELAQT